MGRPGYPRVVRAGLVADLTGFEPATSALTGRRALQTAPQVLGSPVRSGLSFAGRGVSHYRSPGSDGRRAPAGPGVPRGPHYNKLATTLMAMAMIMAPYRYDRRPWPRAIRRMGLEVRFVSETWKVMPMVNER